MLINATYKDWTILSEDTSGSKKHPRVFARCVCGKQKSVLVEHLRSGKSTSCGCKRSLTHGLTHTPEYRVWDHLKQRCLNPANDRFGDYGGRGISVCDRWINSFENFLSDMGERPSGTSIDRIDCDGNYTPENCRWATPKEQSGNLRSARMFNGKKSSLRQHTSECGVNNGTVQSRLRRGWSLDAAMMTPNSKGKRLTKAEKTIACA